PAESNWRHPDSPAPQGREAGTAAAGAGGRRSRARRGHRQGNSQRPAFHAGSAHGRAAGSAALGLQSEAPRLLGGNLIIPDNVRNYSESFAGTGSVLPEGT